MKMFLWDCLVFIACFAPGLSMLGFSLWVAMGGDYSWVPGL